MGKRLGGILQIVKAVTQFRQHQKTLAAHQGGSKHCGQNHDGQCRTEADGPAYLYEQGDFAQRYHQKQQEQAHMRLLR